jgi:hypothetical protein
MAYDLARFTKYGFATVSCPLGYNKHASKFVFAAEATEWRYIAEKNFSSANNCHPFL